MNTDTITSLYLHELRDLYHLEKQLIEEFEKMKQEAENEKLKQLLDCRAKESVEQLKRIESILKNYNDAPWDHRCLGIEGIIKEAKEVLDQAQTQERKDASIISICNRLNHYELAGYGTARIYAEQLRKPEEADMLIESLSELSQTDHALSTLAWRSFNLLYSNGAL